MTDEADRSEEETEFLMEVHIKDNHSKVTKIQNGIAGECDKCGDESPRLIDGNCCRCRDKFKLL